MSHSKSKISNVRRCYATGRTDNLDRHHIWKASRRKLSEKYGMWVYLNHSVHQKMHDHNSPYETLEEDLKRIGQKAFEREGSREEFVSIFGANYLD